MPKTIDPDIWNLRGPDRYLAAESRPASRAHLKARPRHHVPRSLAGIG